MSSKLHVLMYPWFATGHMTPFIHLANNFAEKGHRVTFLLPKKALKQLQHLNLYPNNFVFHSVTVPHVDGLPVGTETASEVTLSESYRLASAMDLTRDQVEDVVRSVKPDLIFFDYAHWVTEIAREYGVKTVNYILLSAAAASSFMVPGGGEFGAPPPGYPSSKVVIHKQDAYTWKLLVSSIEDLKAFGERIGKSFSNCDALLVRACRELEGKFCDFAERNIDKKMLFAGPMLPEPAKSISLDEHWRNWLGKFELGSVVFCALGSHTILEKDQFQELCLGMELTGLPFLVAVKPPKGVSTIQEALPEGFEERVKNRGVVWEKWVQQPEILSHPSVGCFVSHCGLGSMWESLASDCQIVLLPQLAEQVINTRFMSEELEVAVEVAREESGWFSKENLRDAIDSVMRKDSEVGNVVRKNHTKWREMVTSHELMNGYVDNFIEAFKDLIVQ